MIIFCLGTKASGSTWIFNALRAMAAYSEGKSISFYGDDVETFIHNFEAVDGLIIVKCHFMNQRLFDLANLLNAKIIVSSRDPRDSAVSLAERFKYDLKSTLKDLSHSYSSILSIPLDFEILKLRYGIDLLFDQTTLRQLLKFVELDLPDAIIDELSLRLSHASVAERVSDSTFSGDPVKCFEPDTHWHPNHVGDAQTGKWRNRLDPVDAQVIEAALLPMDTANDTQGMTLFLPASVFNYSTAIGNSDKILLENDGAEHCLVWGPYFHLPPGRWIAEYLIEVGNVDLTIKIDVYEGAPNGLIGLKSIELGQHNPSDLQIEFNHSDPSHPVETRIFSVADGHKGNFMFSGVKMTRCGPSSSRKFNIANHIRPYPS